MIWVNPGFKAASRRPLVSFPVLLRDSDGRVFIRILLAKAFVEDNKLRPVIIAQDIIYSLLRLLGLGRLESMLEEAKYNRLPEHMLLSELSDWFIWDAAVKDADYRYLFRLIEAADNNGGFGGNLDGQILLDEAAYEAALLILASGNCYSMAELKSIFVDRDGRGNYFRKIKTGSSWRPWPVLARAWIICWNTRITAGKPLPRIFILSP